MLPVFNSVLLTFVRELYSTEEHGEYNTKIM